MAAPYFVPSADLLPYWPHDLIATSDVGMLGRVSQYLGVTDFDLIEYEGALNLVGKLALWQQLVLDLPLIDGVALVIGQPGLNLTALPFELNFGPPADDDTGDAAEKALNLFLKGVRAHTSCCCPRWTSGCASIPTSCGRCARRTRLI